MKLSKIGFPVECFMVEFLQFSSNNFGFYLIGSPTGYLSLIPRISTVFNKSTIAIHFPFISKFIDLCFEQNCFPYNPKLAEVSPVFKKNHDLDKENYRPASILFYLSKVFERIT